MRGRSLLPLSLTLWLAGLAGPGLSQAQQTPSASPAPQPSQPAAPSLPPAPSQRDPTDDVRRISVEEARKAQLAGEVTIIDVRGRDEFAAQHIAGAINMSMFDVTARAAELSKEKLIVAYCTCGAEHSSARAALDLTKAGFPKTAALLGGLLTWKGAGYPIEGTEVRKRLERPVAPPPAVPPPPPTRR